MKTSDLFDTLDMLTALPGPSGGESPAADAILSLWEPLVDSVLIDRVGNVVAVKRGTQEVEEGAERRSVQLSAHMDEIGLLVTEITEAHNFGFLRVTKVGGIDVRQQYAHLMQT